jgi:SAM-dependent methyltransferase
MNKYLIRDECRANLNRYTIQAFSSIPEIRNPIILDAGCGTGVVDFAIIEVTDGMIYALDINSRELDWFREKVNALGLNGRIRIIHDTIFNPALFDFKFDIILAEGLLNMTGFEKGLTVLLNNLKDNGYLIIHDELKNDTEKRNYFMNNNLKLINSIELNEEIWWNDYCRCLETRIREAGCDELFSNEINEISMYRQDPQSFRSVFYILQNENYLCH